MAFPALPVGHGPEPEAACAGAATPRPGVVRSGRGSRYQVSAKRNELAWLSQARLFGPVRGMTRNAFPRQYEFV